MNLVPLFKLFYTVSMGLMAAYSFYSSFFILDIFKLQVFKFNKLQLRHNSNMTKFILVVSFFLILATANLPSEVFSAAWLDGHWTSQLIANQFSAGKPAQHFVCGIRLLPMKWQKQLDCRCQTGFYNWRWRYFCLKCLNTFWSKISGISITYCSYTNWHEQVIKEIHTNSPDSGGWRPAIKCKQNYYASGIAVSSHVEHGTNLGLIGIKLRCSTNNYQFHQQISDSTFHYYTNMFTPKAGKFLSGIYIKYIPNQNLAGITAHFEAMAKITAVDMRYNLNTRFESLSTNIQKKSVTNCVNEVVNKKVTLDKIHETYSQWQINDKYFLSAKLSKDIFVQPPSLQKQQNKRSVKKVSSDPFAFQTRIKNSIKSAQQVSVIVRNKTKVTVSTDASQLKGSFGFHALLTFSQELTGAFITKLFVEGEWSGITQSQINVVVVEDKAVCQSGIY